MASVSKKRKEMEQRQTDMAATEVILNFTLIATTTLLGLYVEPKTVDAIYSKVLSQVVKAGIPEKTARKTLDSVKNSIDVFKHDREEILKEVAKAKKGETNG